MGAHDLFGASKDLVQGQGGRVEDDGVGGWLQGRFDAIAVACVPLLHLTEDSFLFRPLLICNLRVGSGQFRPTGILVEHLKRGSYLTVAAVAANLRSSIEKNFDLRVGEYGSTYVTA